MKKSVLTILLFAVSLCLFASPLISDDANLLSPEEESDLMRSMVSIKETFGFDIVIHSTNSKQGKDIVSYSDDYYDCRSGYEKDGVILVLDMEDRYVYISTSGYGMYCISNDDIEWIVDYMAENLSIGLYHMALNNFVVFVNSCLEFEMENEMDRDTFYDTYGDPDVYYGVPSHTRPQNNAYSVKKWVIASLAIGFAISLIVTLVMKSRLKSIKPLKDAEDYARSGSFELEIERDHFLRTSVTRTRIQSSSSSSGGGGTHISSSGHSHGGGGRHF